MAADSPLFDPYRSPSLPEGPIEATAPAGRPGMLTTLCVLCIVLGALGLLNSLFGTVGLVAGPYLQTVFRSQPSPGMSPEMQEANNEFQDEMYAVQLKYWWLSAVGLLLRFSVALLLLLGGVRALSLTPPGRLILLLACGAALPFELAHAIFQSWIMMENMTTMNTFSEKLVAEGSSEEMRSFIRMFFRGTLIGSLIIMYLLSFLKMALYLFGLIYLRKERIRDLFHSPAQAATLAPDLRLPTSDF